MLLFLVLLFWFNSFFFPAGRVKQSLQALFGFIGSSPNPRDKHFAAPRAPRICNLRLLSLPWQPFQVRTCLMGFFGRTCFYSRDVTANFEQGLRWSVRMQQSQLSPPVWVSFQHLPTLSHNTLEEANALFVPLLTEEGTRTLKSQFCSGRKTWGDAPRGKGGFGWHAPGTHQPLLTLPTLTFSHKFIPPQIGALLRFGSAASAGRQRIYLPLTSLGNYFLFLSSLRMALPLLPPLTSFKAFIYTHACGGNYSIYPVLQMAAKRGRFMSLAQVCPGSLWQRFVPQSPTSHYS